MPPFPPDLHSKPSANSKLQSPLSPFPCLSIKLHYPTLLLFTTINKRRARECSQQRFASIDLCDRNDARTSPRAFSPIYLCPSRDHATEESPPGLLSRFATVETLFLFPVPFVAAILSKQHVSRMNSHGGLARVLSFPLWLPGGRMYPPSRSPLSRPSPAFTARSSLYLSPSRRVFLEHSKNHDGTRCRFLPPLRASHRCFFFCFSSMSLLRRLSLALPRSLREH